MNLKELFNLAGGNGKLVFVDENGEVKGVFLNAEAYYKLVGKETKSVPSEPVIDPEKINREITKAQLEEPTSAAVIPNEAVPNVTLEQPVQQFSAPMHINSAISQRAQELFKSMPFGRIPEPDIDLRSEVIDPTFSFNNTESTEDEEIKTSFEDV